VSRLEDALAAGRFVVTAEMPTIDGGGLAEVRHQLEPMAPYLDAVNATDNTAAHAHASPLAVAIALRDAGMEPDIVGASMHGIENLCCLTGDDVTAGDEPEARRVFDLDSPALIATARGIAEGRYLSGRTTEPAPRLFIGAVENPGAPPYEYRVDRAAKKVAAGARFLQLQISFEPERLDAFMAEAMRTGLHERAAIIPSITILRSARALHFMHDHVPGITVPRPVIDRVEAAADPLEACLDLAHEQAAHAMSLPGVAGLHFISFRKDAGIAKTCRRLGIPTYEERVSHGHGSPVAV
jgi:methylenetetrahydrofolate reductase (NADPH)